MRECELVSSAVPYRCHSLLKRASFRHLHLLCGQARSGTALPRSGSFRSAGSQRASLFSAQSRGFSRLGVEPRGLDVLSSVCPAVGSAPGGARGWVSGGHLLRPSRPRGAFPRGSRTRPLPGRLLLLCLWWLQSPEHVLVRSSDSEASGSQRRRRRGRRAHSASGQE